MAWRSCKSEHILLHEEVNSKVKGVLLNTILCEELYCTKHWVTNTHELILSNTNLLLGRTTTQWYKHFVGILDNNPTPVWLDAKLHAITT